MRDGNPCPSCPPKPGGGGVNSPVLAALLT